MLKIRKFDFSERDYEDFIKINDAIWPDQKETVEQLKFADKIRDKKSEHQRFIVEFDNLVVAKMTVSKAIYTTTKGKYYFNIEVLPEFQRQGIGTKLYEKMLAIVMPKNLQKLSTYSREDKKNGIAFFEKNGFKMVLRDPVSELDLMKFDFSKFQKDIDFVEQQNIKLIPLSEIMKTDENWQQKLYQLDIQIEADMPTTDPFKAPPFEKWKKSHLENPQFYPKGCIIAVDNGEFVGLSMLAKVLSDKTKMEVWSTGVLRTHRRRKIATALKVLAQRKAIGYGAKTIITDNEENNPMYQINLKLGFEPKPAWLSFEKTNL
ncbi:MAG: GNAT family N-acetyltransferase [Candidatus Cloacimonetes bacterium]|jgi:mycothiol synthase|nr:GNAT family N-acetyltransferase [Candidatus Cloacimonadota bacterium]MBT6993630.1 GNAT family N-acetyltransferase [Candidatus Cloacimonadota bacterium]